jgi:hypothetical protein
MQVFFYFRLHGLRYFVEHIGCFVNPAALVFEV